MILRTPHLLRRTEARRKSAGMQGLPVGPAPIVPGSVVPEILEPVRRHFGVADRMHDIFVAHVVLERSSVMPLVGELVAGRVPEHVRVDREGELCGFSGAGDHLEEACCRGGTTALGDENVSDPQQLFGE